MKEKNVEIMTTKELRQRSQQEFYLTRLSTTFSKLIPSTAKSIIFTDKVMPLSATLINVNEDGDVVAWLDGTTMYVSTQNSDAKVEANSDSKNMFYFCSNLTTLDLSNFDTSNITDMSYMFGFCSALTTLDVSNFDTSNVTDMSYMLGFCSALTTLDVSKWDTSNVVDMNEMFYKCSGLTAIKVGDKFKWVNTLSSLDLSGTWQDETGTRYTFSDTFPSNVAHTYTKVS